MRAALLLAAAVLVAGCTGAPRESYCYAETSVRLAFDEGLNRTAVLDIFAASGWTTSITSEEFPTLDATKGAGASTVLRADVAWSHGGESPETLQNATTVSLAALAEGPESTLVTVDVREAAADEIRALSALAPVIPPPTPTPLIRCEGG